MKWHDTSLPGVVLIEAHRVQEENGGFTETLDYAIVGDQRFIHAAFVQDNSSLSSRRNTLRGLHYQRPPHAQAKLVRCARGAFLDVAVDVRVGSPCFGKWVAVEVSYQNRRRLYIPEGFLHGFLTLEDDTVIEYKCTDFYYPECDGAVRWDSLGIDWGTTEPFLSDKDGSAIPFEEFDSPFLFARSP